MSDADAAKAARVLVATGIIDIEDVPAPLRARLSDLEPRWTKEPPTEPGFYWVREPNHRGTLGAPRAEELKSGLWWTPGSDASAAGRELDGWLFWSERLEPPAVR